MKPSLRAAAARRSSRVTTSSDDGRVLVSMTGGKLLIVSELLAERQGFEPRYRGPESGAWITVGFGPLRFAPVFSISSSVCFPPFRCALVQSVSLCLTPSAHVHVETRQHVAHGVRAKEIGHHVDASKPRIPRSSALLSASVSAPTPRRLHTAVC